VISWIRNGSQGHCELFASAFVLLARDAGFPARLVVGFAGGSWNSVEDYFVIRNRDAHSWVEIFDRDSNEWLRVDPTPGSGSSDPEAVSAGNFGFETGWGAWVDSLRIQWYRRIVNFEQKDQIEMALSLKDMVKAFTEEFSARAKAAVAEFKAWVSQPFSAGNFVRGLVVLLFLLSLLLLWRVRYAVLGLIFRLLRRPKALDPIRRQASRYLKRLDEIHGDGVPAALKLELQTLRFGPEVEGERAQPIFARAKKALRKGNVPALSGIDP
jgi:protein-glutamine gamma-glutamyltransferase